MDKAARESWVARGCQDPLQAYHQHACNALRRGIDFDLTFAEWWAIWEPRYHERGRGVRGAQMCRSADQGPYAVGNVRIDTGAANLREAKTSAKARVRAVADPEWLRNPFRSSMGYFRAQELMEESDSSDNFVGPC